MVICCVAAVAPQLTENGVGVPVIEMPPASPVPDRLSAGGRGWQRFVPVIVRLDVNAPYVVGAKEAVSDWLAPPVRLNVPVPTWNGEVSATVTLEVALPELVTAKFSVEMV